MLLFLFFRHGSIIIVLDAFKVYFSEFRYVIHYSDLHYLERSALKTLQQACSLWKLRLWRLLVNEIWSSCDNRSIFGMVVRALALGSRGRRFGSFPLAPILCRASRYGSSSQSCAHLVRARRACVPSTSRGALANQLFFSRNLSSIRTLPCSALYWDSGGHVIRGTTISQYTPHA